MGLWLALIFSLNAHAHFVVVGGDILREEYGLDYLNYDLRLDAVVEQRKAFGGKFRPALRSAMNCFLQDYSDPESPLSTSILLAFEILRIPEQEPVPRQVLRKAKQILFRHLNQGTAEIRLLFSSEEAEGGETPKDSWVFGLKIKTLSDHLNFAVVDRKGRKATYCYGFN